MKKKILYFNHGSIVGGASWCLLEIIQELDRSVFEPVVVLGKSGPLVNECEQLNVKVIIEPQFPIVSERYQIRFPLYGLGAVHRHSLQFLRLSRCLRVMKKICASVSPDIVHLNSSVYFPIAWAAKSNKKKPKVVLHVREHWQMYGWCPYRKWFKQWVVKNHVDEVLSITHAGAECFGVENRAVIARDWPDFSTRDSDVDVREALGIQAGSKIFLVPGGIHPSKGTWVAIEAFSELSRKVEGCVLVVLGIPPVNVGGLSEKIKNRLSRLGLHFSVERIYAAASGIPSDRIFLQERVMDIKPYMQASLAIISPFVIPHAAKAALEAGYLSRSAILTDWPEAREYVQDGKTGVLVPPADVAALARAMAELISCPEKIDALEHNASEYVKENFNRADSMESILNAYKG